MLKKIALGLVAIIAVFVLVVATRPSTFRYERSTTIAAPPEVVFARINDFHEWAKWSPWEKLDPNLKRSYDGAPSGVGAKYGWVGNDQVGEGRMTMEEAKANERVRVKLEFIKPWEATSAAIFTLAQDGGGTRVVWAMEGENNFAAKAMCLFMDMDKMIGSDFEKGLADLKKVAEAEATKAAPTAEAK